MITTRWALSIVAFVTLGVGCTGEDVAGTGDLQFTATGGGFMREGIPFEEAGFDSRHEFQDGWTLRFDHFLMSVGRLEFREQLADGATGEGELVEFWDDGLVVDMMRPPSGAPLADIEGLPARRFDLGFEIVPATASVPNGSATQEHYERMIAEGWTAWVGGSASRDGTTIEFSIGLDTPTRFRRCANGKDGTRGVAIEASSKVGVTIYPHPVHLWWDVLLQGEQTLRFDTWAAVAGDDGVVTAEELATQDLLNLLDADGNPLVDPVTGGEVRYDDGGLLPPDQLDLLSFVEYGFRQSVHFNGLGFCPWSPL